MEFQPPFDATRCSKVRTGSLPLVLQRCGKRRSGRKVRDLFNNSRLTMLRPFDNGCAATAGTSRPSARDASGTPGIRHRWR